MVTPQQAGFVAPAETQPQAACWTAWPAHRYAWGDQLEPARIEVASVCKALVARPGAERVELLVADREQLTHARRALGDLGDRIRYHTVSYGDIWLRDIGPLFTCSASAQAALCFRFNGWGGKYVYPNDDRVSHAVAELCGLHAIDVDLVLEGGAIEVDGQGTCLAVRSCICTDSRNPGLSEAEVSERLRQSLGVTQLVWIDQGLRNDHTDGHVDNLARFVGPGTVLCAESPHQDPNHAVHRDVQRALMAARGANNEPLRLLTLPSPGAVYGLQGDLMPASYLNYYAGNSTVVVPAFGCQQDELARQVLARCFPDRRCISLPARALLEGGGGFHCITRPQPRAAYGAVP